VYDLTDDMREAASKVQRLLESVGRDLGSGVLLAVCEEVFPLRKAKEAFQFMFEGKHVGKIVFEHPKLRRNELVVVSGAFGGLGKVYSRTELAGETSKVLLGRRGLTEEEKSALEGARGRQVLAACDVGRAEETRAAVRAGREWSGAGV
jgi:hypothetical protein